MATSVSFGAPASSHVHDLRFHPLAEWGWGWAVPMTGI
ncbi:hypothetical protein B005_0141 [Nocardiopsis alba ATCC BAA-2165]|uniref:Uncharacterized protein n=1 Tax=Nocardiopsis alba (strain ATCC BAA-2165 / BE74) TaxID=1205910 RepID=J7LH09_NOCAA|nr:hypothetical protein B005_0141 [Nocardiopsis alba ATCC BAA-2165]